jgi:hypothetical protein
MMVLGNRLTPPYADLGTPEQGAGYAGFPDIFLLPNRVIVIDGGAHSFSSGAIDVTEFSQLLPGVPFIESPLFEKILPELALSAEEEQVARSLRERGYAVIDFPDGEIHERIDRIIDRLKIRFSADLDDPASVKTLPNQRIQDAWLFDEDVRAIASNANVIDLLSRLYGRPAFPFQTLNFPVGTQQHVHSDAIHFSSQPERFMCGVWLAMEDIHSDAGPLNYCPGSHQWPIVSNAMLGVSRFGDHSRLAQEPYEAIWDAMIDVTNTPIETFLARKGQALIWAANLLHGGSHQKDVTRTRWSQVTHYYFSDCLYYTPAFSEEPLGRLELRNIVNIATGKIEPNRLFGKEISLPRENPKRRFGLKKLLQKWRSKPDHQDGLPADFDRETYLKLNPDVAAAGHDPIMHYLKHGRAESRLYRSS